jgi:2-epi-5-epi-valiolone synthase
MTIKRDGSRWMVTTKGGLRWNTELRRGLLALRPDTYPDLYGPVKDNPRRLLVVDDKFMSFHRDELLEQADAYGIKIGEPYVLTGGEHVKTPEQVDRMHARMEDAHLSRFGTQVIVWGGGTLHDLAGLAAGTFRRGVEWRFFGTTLVAAIDAGFALKCAVNLPLADGSIAKNRLGLYAPAAESFADPTLFDTLNPEQILDGVGEIVKFGLCGSTQVMRLLETDGPRAVSEKFQGDDARTQEMLTRTVAGMLKELHDNPREDNPRRKSYLGHGVSPAFEPTVTHGQAVVLDALLTAIIGRRRGLLRPEHFDRIAECVSALGLRLWHPIVEQVDLYEALLDTARHRGGQQLIPVPERVGTVAYLNDITPNDLDYATAELRALAS